MKFKIKKEVILMNENQDKVLNKTSINWYIPPLINFPTSPYFIRVFDESFMHISLKK